MAKLEFRGNHPKEEKLLVLEAIKKSGIGVQWRDMPNEQMPAEHRDQYGSIWGPYDCTAFWHALYELRKTASTPTSAERDSE